MFSIEQGLSRAEAARRLAAYEAAPRPELIAIIAPPIPIERQLPLIDQACGTSFEVNTEASSNRSDLHARQLQRSLLQGTRFHDVENNR